MTNEKKSLIPYFIITAFVLFMMFIGQFIYRSINLPVNLVSDDYYEKELKYQDHIDMVKRSTELNKKIKISYLQQQVIVQIKFPENIKIEKGIVHFYRADDSRLDQKIALKNDKKNTTSISSENLKKGPWIVKLFYQIQSVNYFLEQKIWIK